MVFRCTTRYLGGRLLVCYINLLFSTVTKVQLGSLIRPLAYPAALTLAQSVNKAPRPLPDLFTVLRHTVHLRGGLVLSILLRNTHYVG